MNKNTILKLIWVSSILLTLSSTGSAQSVSPENGFCCRVNGANNPSNFGEYCSTDHEEALILSCNGDGGFFDRNRNCQHEPFDGHGGHGISCISNLVCESEAGFVLADEDGLCPVPVLTQGKDHGCPGSNGAGNPCNVSTGNKYQFETDFTSGNSLSFTRSYNSQNLINQGLGNGWRHNFQPKLIVAGDSLVQVSGTGRREPWVKVGGIWRGDVDSNVVIFEVASGFQLIKDNNTVENYSSTGLIESFVDANGQEMTYDYNADETLAQVTNKYGLYIKFTYTDEMLSSVTDALGVEYLYEFDENYNLINIIYPDETPNDISDNSRRTYHYEDVNYPSHLTGITDENGDRYAVWSYDADGKAISTEHATTTNQTGQEIFQLDFQGAAE